MKVNDHSRRAAFILSMAVFFSVVPHAFSSEITFSVVVPEETAPWDTVFISGNAPELGDLDPNDVPLAENPDGLWEIQVNLTAGETVYYFYSRGSNDKKERGPIGEWLALRMLEVPEIATVVRDTIHRWHRFGPYLSWVNNPRTTMTISWSTDRDGDGRVEFGPDGSYGTVETDTAIGKLHSVELTGLQPSTEYHYRVLSSSGETGVDHTFSTAKSRYDPFTFVAYGDTRTNDTWRSQVVAGIIQEDPDLVFNTGDLIESGYEASQWRTWFSTNQVLLEDTPYFVAIGNHEHNAPIYYDYWHFPGNEQWYSVDYGNAHFICLSTETDLSGDQRDWLEADLAAAAEWATWIFVFFHQPPYSSGEHGSNPYVRGAWCGLFETYEVDIVFNGHDHHYERGLVNGVYYIVTGGGGAPLHNVGTSDWTIYAESTLHFCNLTVESSLLTVETIKPDGTVIDPFTIQKDPVSVADRGGDGLGLSFQLLQNFPNPFNPVTIIEYSLAAPGKTSLKIFNVLGREIVTLVNGSQERGTHRIAWEAGDLPSGIYICRLQTAGFTRTSKIILQR